MLDSVQKDGTVRGPAPLGNDTDENALSAARRDQYRHAAGNESAVPPGIKNGKEPDVSIAAARAALSSALKSQRHLEARLDRVCNRLLIAGEQIPSLDQEGFSMLQEAYVNASLASNIAAEKALIWQARVNRLSGESWPDPDLDNFLLAA